MRRESRSPQRARGCGPRRRTRRILRRDPRQARAHERLLQRAPAVVPAASRLRAEDRLAGPHIRDGSAIRKRIESLRQAIGLRGRPRNDVVNRVPRAELPERAADHRARALAEGAREEAGLLGQGARVAHAPRTRSPCSILGPVIEAAEGPLASAAGASSAAAASTNSRRFIGELLCERSPYLHRRRASGSGGRRRAHQRGLEIGDQVVRRLDPDGQPHEVARARRTERPPWTRASSAPGARSGSRRRRGSPRATRSSFAHAARTASSSDSARNEIMPPKSRICRAAISWPGCDSAARGRALSRPAGAPSRNSAIARARSRSAAASAPPAS